jgi:hypothetical protein
MYKQFSSSLEPVSDEWHDGSRRRSSPAAETRTAGLAADRHPAVEPGLREPGAFSTLPPAVASASLLQLQRLSGNLAVRRWIQRSRGSAEGESEVSPAVERVIDSSRGGGHPLDQAARSSIGGALNADFSGVRVHTDTQASALSESLGARAFTTGQDIYFRQGEYSPGSSAGRGLLAHELTHVVQQNPAVARAADEQKQGLCPGCQSGPERGLQAKLAVSSPGDRHEQEADSVAREFSRREQLSPSPLSRQIAGEEHRDEKPHAKLADGMLSRQPEEDADKDHIARVRKDDEEIHRKPEEDEHKKLA